MFEQRIQQHFFDSADLQYQCAEGLSRSIADAANAVVGSITAGGKLLVCGHGPALASGHFLLAQWVGAFERERPGLAAVMLSSEGAMATSLGAPGDALARQVQAIGAPGDVLVMFTASDTGAEMLPAARAAHGKDMTIVAFTGKAAAALAADLGEADVHVAVPHERPARIHEVHLLCVHALCDAVDLQLMGEQDLA